MVFEALTLARSLFFLSLVPNVNIFSFCSSSLNWVFSTCPDEQRAVCQLGIRYEPAVVKYGLEDEERDRVGP